MCGIAGYSLGHGSRRRPHARRAGAAGRDRRARRRRRRVRPPRASGGTVAVHKQQTGAERAARRASRCPASATQLLVHVRDYTKGHPTIVANNHPIRHGAVVGIHNGIIVNDEELFARHGLRARRAGDDRRLGGDLRAREASDERPARARAALRRDGRRLDRRARPGDAVSSPAASAARSGSGGGGDERLLRLDALALELVEHTLRTEPPQARGRARARPAARWSGGRRIAAEQLPAVTARTARTDVAAGRPRAARGRESASRGSPRSPRSLALSPALRAMPVRAPTLDALLAQPLAHEELERRPGARARRRPCGRPATRTAASDRSRRAVFQSAIFGSRPSRRASTAPCATARSSRSSPTGTSKPASRSAAVSEPNVCQISDFDAIRPRRASRSRAVGVAAELVAELAQLRRAAPRGVMNRRGMQARGALRGVPGAEVLDHRLRMHRRLRIGRELPHRRRPPQPRGARRAAPSRICSSV